MGYKAAVEQEVSGSMCPWEDSGVGVLGNETTAHEAVSVSPDEII